MIFLFTGLVECTGRGISIFLFTGFVEDTGRGTVNRDKTPILTYSKFEKKA